MPKEVPTPASLQDIAQTAKLTALKDGNHIPTIIAEGDQNMLLMQVEEFRPTFDERTQQMFVIGFFLAKNSDVGVLQQVFFISEGWLSVAPKGRLPHSRPSQDPQRKEVLTVSQRIMKPPKTEMIVFEMKRNQRGKLTQLETFNQSTLPSNVNAQSPLLEALVAGYLKSSV